MADEKLIAQAKDPVDATRELIAEKASELTDKSARKLFELPYAQRGRLDDFDEETKKALFETAKEEAAVPSGAVMWGAVFNSYAALLELVRTVRIQGEWKESSGGPYAQQVIESPNRIATVFAIFRKHKDIGEEEARQMLEFAHNTALIGLSTDARRALFAYAQERGVGWFEVTNQYTTLAELVSRIKSPIYAEL